MNTLPDHPVIANLLRTGYPDGREPTVPRCPVCGDEADTFYLDQYGEIVSCNHCVRTIEAWEMEGEE